MTAELPLQPTKDPIWQQVDRNIHRWELRYSSDGPVCATVWWEKSSTSGWWHWSVVGKGIPNRGARKVFREAVEEAQDVAKKAGAR